MGQLAERFLGFQEGGGQALGAGRMTGKRTASLLGAMTKVHGFSATGPTREGDSWVLLFPEFVKEPKQTCHWASHLHT